MAPPVFWRKLGTEDRAALDAEIRRRAYADTCGLSSWLAERGVSITKSAVHKYVRKLKKDDDSISVSADTLSPETARAIVEAAALVAKTFEAVSRALVAIRNDIPGKPS